MSFARFMLAGAVVAGIASSLSVAAAATPERGNVRARIPAPKTARVIVAFKPESATLRAQALGAASAAETVAQVAQARADTLAVRAGVPLTAGRPLGARSQVVIASGLDSTALAARLAADPEVAYAVPDRRVRFTAVPNDPLFAAGPASGQGPAVGQWYLRAPDATLRSAVNAERAWDFASGNASIVVAVLDTGVLGDHPDLAGRVLPGYDMIDDVQTANDGNRRDADASDSGDWITAQENASGTFEDCGVSDSSWHGTSVAGIIGAASNNGVGMAGIASGVRILPVRVLGKCGGYDSDIIAGIYWSVGYPQGGLPTNSTPARVLNLSLGSEGACAASYRDAINTVVAAPYHAVVVAAAGNSSGHAVSAPANCPGVVAVTGLRHAGSKVGFSDLGPEITIAAPGGNCVNIDAGSACLYPILTSTNSGTRSPVTGGSTWSDSFNITVGTSFATPIVAGTAALMLSAQPSLIPLQVTNALRSTARPFPTSGADNGPSDPTPVQMCRAPDGTDQLQCYCSAGLCGAGMLDAAAAVLAASRNATPQDVARQLFEFAEQAYANFFPDRPPTQSSPPFLYRYYPSTGAYLGVVVQSDSQYALDGVYVIGGPFGSALLHGGPVGTYITPGVSPLRAPRSR